MIPSDSAPGRTASALSTQAPAAITPEGSQSRLRTLVAMWCSSVGSTWTVELREAHPGTRGGKLVAWISSGVPISHPEPAEAEVRDLLADHGLYLHPDSTACPGSSSRHCIGYVSQIRDIAHWDTFGR